MTDLKTWYVSKDVNAYDDEWKFSDSHIGESDTIRVFPSLEAGMAKLSPCIIIFNTDPLQNLTAEQRLDHRIMCALLQPVKQWLESGAKHTRGKGIGFNMSVVFDVTEEGNTAMDYKNNKCGTAMCIGGGTSQFNGLGLEHNALDKLLDKFESIRAELYELFYANEANNGLYEITPKQALQAIENFEKYCDPKWDEIE